MGPVFYRHPVQSASGIPVMTKERHAIYVSA